MTSTPSNLASALQPFVPADSRPVSSGTEEFGTDPKDAPVGEYIPKLASRIQASGEARYPSDWGSAGTLIGQLVFSTAANAKLSALDATKALAMPGVKAFIVASDIPGQNAVNPALGKDNLVEKLFFQVGDIVPCVGSQLGLIVADTWSNARRAAKQVVQGYTDHGPVVTSIEEAKRLRRVEHSPLAHSNHRRRNVRDDLAQGVDCHHSEPRAGADMMATATFKTGGQRHFYMETQSVYASSLDGDEWEIVCSDQDSNFSQQNLALVLGIPAHKINVKVPRAGGAFGGKLTRQLLTACACAVASHQLGVPVRIQNERSDDLQVVAGREPIDFDYTVTFDSEGTVDTLEMNMAMDPGYFYADASGDMSMAVGWADNCYYYNNFKVTTSNAVTNTPHSTSMRAPGCMQSILAAQVVMEHVAKTVGKDLDTVQQQNFYDLATRNKTPFGDVLGRDNYNWTIPTLWTEIQSQADYANRKEAVAAYNAANRWTKKGIALTPAKYVIGDTYYSSGALVNIYSDGTVLVSSGGSELGQGLNTKIALCVASTLSIPLGLVSVGPRETSKVPNNTATGGSGTSECSSNAAILACETLMARLKPYLDAGKTWVEAVTQADTDGVSLMATGWFKQKATANANTYSTYGTAISEVLIDVLTGEIRVERVDIHMDLGNQLDAAVDIGQLQGGYVTTSSSPFYSFI